MKRREFLHASVAAAAAGCVRASSDSRAVSDPRVMTVTGSVPVSKLGLILPHEHVMVDFIGADQVGPHRYDAEEIYRTALPWLEQANAAGVRTFFDCTPAWLGRDARLLQRLSLASRMNIVTNTGYYGASNHKHLPAHTWDDTVDALAARWITEARDGIEGTGIRPGFIKIGVDAAPLSPVQRKLVQAAARTHRATGLAIACHTGDGAAALEELDILETEMIRGDALIWVHAQSESDTTLHRKCAERGAWIEFDGVGPDSMDRHLELLNALRDAGRLDRALLSHDSGWYTVGEPGGGTFRGYTVLCIEFIPRLRDAGYSPAEIEQLTVTNPARAFGIQTRVKA